MYLSVRVGEKKRVAEGTLIFVIRVFGFETLLRILQTLSSFGKLLPFGASFLSLKKVEHESSYFVRLRW